MLPVDVFTDAEAAAIDYLTPLLAADPDFADTTIDVRNGDGHHIRVRRVGGIELSHGHDLPQLDVMIWHDTDRLRMRLAQRLWAWFRAANNDPAGASVICYSSTTLGPLQMPDPADTTKTVCMFTITLIVRPA